MKSEPKFSGTSKMPCKSWSLPAIETCPGSVGKDGSLVPACRSCYATKNFYKMEPAKNLRSHNLADWKRAGWVEAMVQEIQKKKFFRWFDSGDIYDPLLAKKIFLVCYLTPTVIHWIPTRSFKIPAIALELKELELLHNVVVRKSSDSTTGETIKGKNTSTILQSSKDFKPKMGSVLCRAFERSGKCGKCRACWNPKVEVVYYVKH